MKKEKTQRKKYLFVLVCSNNQFDRTVGYYTNHKEVLEDAIESRLEYLDIYIYQTELSEAEVKKDINALYKSIGKETKCKWEYHKRGIINGRITD